jgi:hypothetical protein
MPTYGFDMVVKEVRLEQHAHNFVRGWIMAITKYYLSVFTYGYWTSNLQFKQILEVVSDTFDVVQVCLGILQK